MIPSKKQQLTATVLQFEAFLWPANLQHTMYCIRVEIQTHKQTDRTHTHSPWSGLGHFLLRLESHFKLEFTGKTLTAVAHIRHIENS